MTNAMHELSQAQTKAEHTANNATRLADRQRTRLAGERRMRTKDAEQIVSRTKLVRMLNACPSLGGPENPSEDASLAWACAAERWGGDVEGGGVVWWWSGRR